MNSIESGRRRVLQLLAGSAATSMSVGMLHAADVAGPVKFVVNFAPGGAIDIIARDLAAKLTATTQRTFVVENVLGAGGLVGAGQVARAEPDARTLLLSLDTPFTMSALLTPMASVPLDRFQVVAVLGAIGSTLAVNPALGVRSLAELIERGRRKELTFASAGNGTPGHFGALLLASKTGIKVVSVPYKGSAPATNALLSGEVDAGVLSTSGLLPHLRAGKLRGLAITSERRSALLPDVPTVAELGYRSLEMETMFVALAPANTPPAQIAALRQLIVGALGQSDTVERLRAQDITPSHASGADALARLTAARDRNAQVAREAGLKAE